MKVSELIKALQDCQPEMEVVVYSKRDDMFFRVIDVDDIEDEIELVLEQ